MKLGFLILIFALVLVGKTSGRTIQNMVNKANKKGPYLGLIVPNLFEMNPLLESPRFISTNLTIDFSGKRFRFGEIEGKKVIIVMTGLGMLNAGITTQLLLSIFKISGVLHYGIAGNANPSLHIGDVTIPQYWSHTALWNWQRYGDGPEDELSLEVFGDYTRDIGYLNIGEYTTIKNTTKISKKYDNSLNNIWYQPEEIFPVDGKPEERQHVFWVPVDSHYFQISKSLEKMELEGCLNATTCLSTPPKVIGVDRGTSASIYLDNAAYRNFLYNKFNISPVDMESVAIALVSYQQRIPFIIFRALSDLAGGGPESNEAATFISLAANNGVAVVIQFIKNL